MRTTAVPHAGLIAASLALYACGTSSPPGPAAGAAAINEPTGQVSLAITVVPPGVQCIQVTASGSTTITQTFSVTPDAGTLGLLSLGELPVGPVAITGQAYSVACAGIGSAQPSWVADKQVVTIQGGVVTSLTITFHPDNPVTGTPNFVGNVVQMAAGGYQIAAVMSDGTVEAAGFLWNGYSSQTFGPVGGLSNIAQIAPSISDGWACALLKTGTVECWGTNGDGQLGNGTTTSSTIPVTVTGLTGIVQIAAGGDHACAVGSNGYISCWGFNADGQVGNSTTTNATTPAAAFNNTTSSVAAGENHTCAIFEGLVYCWGYNGYGQLGNGTTSNATFPIYLSSLNAITQLALGQFHSCALRADGSVLCWGDNNLGQLGLGNTTNSLTPARVSISNVQQIAAGFFSTCARRGDGTVWCWGDDQYGEVGDGTGSNTGITSPVQVVGLPPSASLAGGGYNFCSVGTDGAVWCWGYNTDGQLGNGNPSPAFVPTPIKL